jgi:hypothetical protein
MALAFGVVAIGCGDDDDRDLLGTAGRGGAGGSANVGGMGGMGGGAAGRGGAGGSGGGVTVFPASCSGCVDLAVPLTPTSASRQAQFLFRPAAVVDMSNTTITWKVKVVTPTTEIPADAMYIAPFAQNGQALNYAGDYAQQIPLNAANGFTSAETWVDVLHDVAGAGVTPPAGGDAGDAGDGVVDAGDGDSGAAPAAGGFDKTQVFQYGLYVGATAAFTGTGTVRVAVDSVTYTDPAFTDVTFTANAEGFQLDPYMVPPGSTLTHRP